MPRLKQPSKKPLSEDVVENVKSLYQSGASVNTIATELSLSETQVMSIVTENNLASEPTTSSRNEVQNKEIVVSQEDETKVLDICSFVETFCWDLKSRILKQLISKLASDAGMRHIQSLQWRDEFMKKHAEKLSPRVNAAFRLQSFRSTLTKDDFFVTLQHSMERLTQDPNNIWSFGAVDVLLPEPPKKVSRKNERQKEEHVTAMLAVSAAGSCTPATLLFKGSRVASEWKGLLSEDFQERINLFVNESGCMDLPSSIKWMRSFVRVVTVRPVILFCDAVYCTLENYEFFKIAREANVQLITIPRALSSSVRFPFASNGGPVHKRLQDRWYEQLDDVQINVCPTAMLTRPQVVQTFAPAFSSLDRDFLVTTYAKCGLFPLNPGVDLQEESFEPEDEPMESKNDLLEIPPLSPRSLETVNYALSLYAQAGISERKALRLLRNMNVPGFAAPDEQ